MRVSWSHRPPTAPMGRFGGGWQWHVGVQAGRLSRARGTVIVSLLVASARVEWGAPPAPDPPAWPFGREVFIPSPPRPRP